MPEDDLEMISIPVSEYRQLLEDSTILEALYAGGVDNWEWYEDALANIGDE